MEMEIIGRLKEEFIVPENVPENITNRDKYLKIAKASFALLFNSDKLVSFLGAACSPTQSQSQWLCHMPEKKMEFRYNLPNGNQYRFLVDTLKLNSSARFHDPIFLPHNVTLQKEIYNGGEPIPEGNRDNNDRNALNEWSKTSEQELFSYFGSLYGLCNKLAKYSRTPDEVFRYFGAANTLPLAGWKTTGSIRQANFHISGEPSKTLKDKKTNVPGWTEEALVNSLFLDALKQSLFSFELPQEYIKTYHGWFKQIFEFKNEFGETTMLAVKIYDFHWCWPKMIFPLTVWSKNQENSKRLFFIPGAGLSPLYNLDLLSREECQTVILTDSIEIADLNQEKAPDGVVFTSFLCDSGRYEEVDWSPLKGKDLYWLIVNHSGCTLVDAYRKAATIRDYLLEKEKLELKFIQLPVKYPDKWSLCCDLVDVVEYRRNNPPEIDAENITVLSGVEFNSYLEKAENFIVRPPKDWWDIRPEEVENVAALPESTPKREFLMHPILPRNESVLLHAGKNKGKSYISYMICACLTAFREKGTVSFLPEYWWTVNRNPKYQIHKVLYLDFENGATEIDARRKIIEKAYWDNVHKEESAGNFIIEDMTREGVVTYDYTQPANHQKLFDLLDAAEKQGIQGQPVDLLVIDTYTCFINNKEDSTTTARLRDLLKELHRRNLTVLIITHESSDATVKGYKEKLEGMYITLRIYRDDANDASLEDSPANMRIMDYRGNLPQAAWKPFLIQQDPESKKIQVVLQEGEDRENVEAKFLLDYAGKYKSEGTEIIAQRMGLGESQYFEKKKKALELLGKK